MFNYKDYLLKESVRISEESVIISEIEPKYKKYITKEMEDHYIARTLTHINRVQDNIIRMLKLFPVNNDTKYKLIEQATKHDLSKFTEPERSLYILISWKYHLEEDDFKKLNIPDWLQLEMVKISEVHVKKNPHHPEYWDDNLISGFLDPQDRDEIDDNLITHCEKMPDNYIIEMACDWCSVSEELGSDPNGWADKTIGTRFKFTDEQTAFIYKLINILKTEKNLGNKEDEI